MEIVKTLVLSTAHLKAEHFANVSSEAWGSVVYDLPYGALLHVPESDDAQTDPDVRKVQAFARAQGCVYVLFDQDADTVPDIPTWAR